MFVCVCVCVRFACKGRAVQMRAITDLPRQAGMVRYQSLCRECNWDLAHSGQDWSEGVGGWRVTARGYGQAEAGAVASLSHSAHRFLR